MKYAKRRLSNSTSRPIGWRAGPTETSRAPSYLVASHQQRMLEGFVPAESPAFFELRNGIPQT
jgi:hypothetical protein